MVYTALYRTFRPTTFEEMVGQEHITKTLKNQITAGRVGHAYLFNGGRGTGKTSAAKILARAINCLNPKDGEPCNECEICKAALNGSLTDIVEMDAASNNSVEDIRQIRDEVNFLPTKAKYRVYIIDEVHMLSTGAFNALLKTLEEPPEHVKFILATTEPQKLPATILSRCQRFDFKKISEENISKRLQIVCKEAGIEITEEALKIISTLAEGAMRDALSILERCMQEQEGKIDEEKVKDLVGIPKFISIHNITKAIMRNAPEEALQEIDNVLKEGKDLTNLLWEMIKYVRDILVYKTSKNTSIYSKEEIANIEELAEKVEKDRLLNIIYELSNLENDMKWSSQKTILFQVGILKLCHGETIHASSSDSSEISNLKNKISELEAKINQIGQSAMRMQNNIGSTTSYQENVASQNLANQGQPNRKAENKIEDVKKENVDKIQKSENKNENSKEQAKSASTSKVTSGNGVKAWPSIVENLKQEGKIMLYTNLINSQAVEINDMTVGISFPKGLTPFGKTILEKNENKTELEKRVSMEFGKPMRIKYIEEGAKTQANESQIQEQNPIETFAQDFDLPFNIIEE